ncbi:MAG: TetM/TetW/TetO/TetS family tetracycline resistance ribosomal protection protein, partial [Lachnospiraceae bacterium]|nr:TetM/TetW/TetO/TetS family tetracycline resistance ribosomal protection protein [Lachnospiraceae bacterium]
MENSRITGVLAHVDAGKTTLSEAMLYLTGTLRKAGRVDHGDTFLDTNDIEKDRGITVFSSQARMSVDGLDVTLLDTPGHVDFSSEMERTLQVLDYAILVISGTDGVQSHTRTLWRLLMMYRIPAFIFVNKMDLPGADRDALMDELSTSLSGSCVDFTSEGDIYFKADAEGGAGGADELLESIAMCSDRLLEAYSDEGNIPLPLAREAVARREMFPVYFGSALHMDGVDRLLRGLTALTLPLESLADIRGEALPSAFAARVYKIGRDQNGARLTWLKITGGSLRVKDPVTYTPRRKAHGADEPQPVTEKIDQIRLYSGERFAACDSAEAGCICTVTGLTAAMPGDGLGAEHEAKDPVLEPVMTRSIELPQGVNPQTFFMSLAPLEEEEPSLHLLYNAATKEIRAQIMGDVQTEILTRLIKERFGVTVTFGPEKILYRETVLNPVIGIGHFEPLRHYAEVHLLIEPGDRGSGVTAASLCPEDILDLNWQRLILTHVLERDHPGVLTGSPLTDVKITLLTGRSHLKHTEGGDFRQATYRAIRQGLKSARTALLEPWYSFVLDIPSSALGRAMSDLMKMGARTGDPLTQGDRTSLTGRVPVSKISSYAAELAAYTHGDGTLSLTPAGYDLCTDPEAVLTDNTYDAESDIDNPTGSVFCAHGAGYLVPWDQVPSYAHCEIPRSVAAAIRDRVGEDAAADLHDIFDADELPEGFSLENGWGRGPSKPASGGADHEDAEFLAVYNREFGHSADETPLPGSNKPDARSRPGYKKKGPSARAY